MARVPSVKATLKGATGVRTVWESNRDFKMGGISLDDFIAIHDATAASDKEYAKKRIELLKVAIGLDRRNASYWKALAEAHASLHNYAESAKAWRSAVPSSGSARAGASGSRAAARSARS